MMCQQDLKLSILVVLSVVQSCLTGWPSFGELKYNGTSFFFILKNVFYLLCLMRVGQYSTALWLNVRVTDLVKLALKRATSIVQCLTYGRILNRFSKNICRKLLD